MTDTKNVVVTGAAGGIGAAVLAELAKRPANVICVDLHEQAVEEVISSIGSTAGEFVAVGADVSKEDEVKRYVNMAGERWGGLDGIFNIAGVEGEPQPAHLATLENLERCLDSNVKGTFLGMKYAVPWLIERGGGTVINVGSEFAVNGYPGAGAYAASKHAIVGLTKCLAVEAAQQNVRANVLCPGPTDTRQIHDLLPKISNDLKEAEALIVSNMPMKSLAKPEELAQTGVWLLLDAPPHLTGQVLLVDGGMAAQ